MATAADLTHLRLGHRELSDEVLDGCFERLLREEGGSVLRVLASLRRDVAQRCT